ncbi:hypothetical protein DX908_02320 [Parvularcula marina]|uniref:Uncharacterized protein n=1 Tax=Parvularcula marina TaxID=2292771 RepID=A0A371RFJ3_9PROT|nr:hypothetical protein DX908_02320 [Parvularcula marina]
MGSLLFYDIGKKHSQRIVRRPAGGTINGCKEEGVVWSFRPWPAEEGMAMECLTVHSLPLCERILTHIN